MKYQKSGQTEKELLVILMDREDLNPAQVEISSANPIPAPLGKTKAMFSKKRQRRD
jgi:hypothetical protein